MRYRCLVAVVFALCVGGTASLSAQQGGGVDTVKQVLDAWEKRRKAMKSVKYKVEGVEIYAKGSMTEDTADAHPTVRKEFPPKDLTFSKQLDYTIDFLGGKIRKEQRDHILHLSTGQFLPRASILVFDGKNVKKYMPSAENTSAGHTPSPKQPELRIYQNGVNTILTQGDYPILFAHGRPNVYCQFIDANGYFLHPLEGSCLRLHQRGKIQGRDCVILRSVREAGKQGLFDECWVDVERDGAILRWDIYIRGSLSARYDTNYSEIDGRWLPRSWQLDVFPTSNGQRQFIRGERLKVLAIEIDPQLSDEMTTVPMKHQMVVSNTRGGLFQVASDDHTLVPFGESTRIWKWWHWLIILLLSGGLLGTLVLLCPQSGRP